MHPFVSSVAEQVYSRMAAEAAAEREFSWVTRALSANRNRTGTDLIDNTSRIRHMEAPKTQIPT